MIKNYKILATIEARTNSNRLPEKVLKKINNLTLLEILISRVKKSKYIDQIVVATTRNKNDMHVSERFNFIFYLFFKFYCRFFFSTN